MGDKEAAQAVADSWYFMKKGANGQPLIFYTEESMEKVTEKMTKKEIKGGSEVYVEAGKNMLCDGAVATFAEGFMGIKDQDEAMDFGVLEVPPVTTGMGSQPQPSGHHVQKKPAAAERPGAQLSPAEKRAITLAAKQQKREEDELAEKLEQKKHAESLQQEEASQNKSANAAMNSALRQVQNKKMTVNMYLEKAKQSLSAASSDASPAAYSSDYKNQFESRFNM